MIYVKFDLAGNQINITQDIRFVNNDSDSSSWEEVTGFDFSAINFREQAFFKNLDDSISLINISAPIDSNEVTADEFSYVDDSGRKLSEELYFEGGGVNSSNTSGWFRRFNGMTINNTTGMMFGRGAVIELIEFTHNSTGSGKRFQLYHYNASGGDSVKIYDKEVNLQNGQFLYEENLSLYVPPERRFAAFMTGGRFRYPQYRIGYRRVF